MISFPCGIFERFIASGRKQNGSYQEFGLGNMEEILVKGYKISVRQKEKIQETLRVKWWLELITIYGWLSTAMGFTFAKISTKRTVKLPRGKEDKMKKRILFTNMKTQQSRGFEFFLKWIHKSTVTLINMPVILFKNPFENFLWQKSSGKQFEFRC